MTCYLGIDVGTASVRGSLVSSTGKIIETAVESIHIWSPLPELYEQSSDDIWRAVICVVKSILEKSGVDKRQVKGIGFDGTCSLVVLDAEYCPVTCSPTGKRECNIIMWMDHRAKDQAAKINATNHDVLKFVGGKMSLEMQPPKLMWLKEHIPDSWKSMVHLFDLPDFLTWRATGSLSRSLCSLGCKWGYEVKSAEKHGWNDDFWTSIGLEDLTLNNHSRIGSKAVGPGEQCGNGLTVTAAEELGLETGTPVGMSLIDAYAGGLACLACVPEISQHELLPITSCMALICGTSTCHMVTSSEPKFVPGVWGPYFSAMIPGLWVNEGGQSATGKLIDFVVENHAAFPDAKFKANEQGVHLYEYLNSLLEKQATPKNVTVSKLTRELHIYPDFHGNRSPLADPTMKGMICGLELSSLVDDLALLYLSTIQSLTYGTKHIISEMNNHGHDIKRLYLCGGLRKNTLFVQTHADVLDMPVILPQSSETVLLGAAILGARASGDYANIQEAMIAMGGSGQVVMPQEIDKKFHEKKYRVFLKMASDQKTYRDLLND